MRKNSYIIKKAIAISKAKSSQLLLLLVLGSSLGYSAEGSKRICFESSVSLKEVQNNISNLLLSSDKIILIPPDHCIDIHTSLNRLNLLELSLKKSYNLFYESKVQSHLGRVNNLCLMVVKTNYFEEAKTDLVPKKSVENELLLSPGKSGSIDVFDQQLEVMCTKDQRDRYAIEFKNLDFKKISFLWANERFNLKEALSELGFSDKKLNETIDIELWIKEENRK